MRQRARRAVCCLVVFGLCQYATSQETAAADATPTLIDQIRERIASCDSTMAEMTFITTVSERELDSDGAVKKEKTLKTRHYVRGEQSREFLEAMWEDGEPVSPKRLLEEQKKRDKEQRKRNEKRRERISKGRTAEDDDGERAMKALEPFRPEYAADYRFPSVASDTLDGRPCWQIAVEAARKDEDLVTGVAWIDQATLRPIAEDYQPAKMPTAIKEFTFRMDYQPVDTDCSFPRQLTMRGRGKALLVIKFRFGVEILFDSLQVNPGLPDSLFSLPTN